MRATRDCRFRLTAPPLPALVALAYAPLLALHAQRLWLNERYHYVLLVAVAAGLLAWQRSRGDPLPPQTRSSRRRRHHRTQTDAGIAAAAPNANSPPPPARRPWQRARTSTHLLALLLLAAAVLFWSPWLAAVSAITLLGAALLGCDRNLRRQLAPVWLLLWLLVPLPFGYDQLLSLSLQAISSRAASALLDGFGRDHLLAGNVIEVPGQRFLVEQACSGIRSLLLLVACAAVFTVASRRRWYHALPLVAAAIALAVIVNVARVSAVVVLQSDAGIDVTGGWRHEVLGAAVFGVGVLLLMSVDQLLLGLLAPLPVYADRDLLPGEEEDEWSHAAKSRSVERRRGAPRADPLAGTLGWGHQVTRFFHSPGMRVDKLTAVAFGLLFIVQLPLLLSGSRPREFAADMRHEPLRDIGQATLPAELHGWTRDSYQLVTRDGDSIYGQYSSSWTFRRNDAIAVVSLDYPFTGWHPLIHCYRGQGWTDVSRQVVNSDAPHDPSAHSFVQLDLAHDSGETALLIYGLFDQHAQPLAAPQSDASLGTSLSRLWRRADSTFARFGLSAAREALPNAGPTYQFQLLVRKPYALTDDDRQRATQLFVHARRMILERWE